MFWPEVYIKKELCRRIHSHLGGDYLVWMISGHLLLATLPPKGPMWNQANLKSSTAGVEEWAVLVEHRRSRDQIRAEGWGAASPRKEVIDAEHGTTIWSRSWPVFQVDETSLKGKQPNPRLPAEVEFTRHELCNDHLIWYRPDAAKWEVSSETS